VAGSSGWENYRHQADVCHAYQILIQSGIPRSKIIVMIYDDIAYHVKNPHKGIIFNAPDGINVYEGVKIDYSGADVNLENFIAVLTGDRSKVYNIGSGRVFETESSYACFYNETMNTFLADVFSYSWMVNSEQSKHSVASLSEQILFVMNRTSNYAHTSVYGDVNIENEKIGRFQGQKQPSNFNSAFSGSIEEAIPSREVVTFLRAKCQ